MDINAIGIGAIIGATVVAGTNLLIFHLNRKKDETKERLKNLYYPLYASIAKKDKHLAFLKTCQEEGFEKFAVEFYKFFLELRDIYLDNKIYESMQLREAFRVLIHNHEMESNNYCRDSSTSEELIKNLALFELKHKVGEDELSEIERNIQKIIEVIQSDIAKMM